MSVEKQILILGIGNVLWADEGFGVRAVEFLQTHYRFAENVTLMDGGTQGLYLLQHVQNADVLIVLDAIDYGLEPGTLKTAKDDEVPSYMGAKKMSLHQTGFQEVLVTAEMLGHCPQQILLIGVQPELLEDYGGSLTQTVREQIEPSVEILLEYLTEQGVAWERLDDSLRDDSGLALQRYESERPSAEQALRVGDPRVVMNEAYEISPKPGLEDGMSVDVDHRGKYEPKSPS